MLRISLKYAITCLFVLSMAQVDLFGMDVRQEGDREGDTGMLSNFESMEDFIRPYLLGDGGVSSEIRAFIDGRLVRNALWEQEDCREFFTDKFVFSNVCDYEWAERVAADIDVLDRSGYQKEAEDRAEELREIEVRHKLPRNSLFRIVEECRRSRNANSRFVKNLETVCEACGGNLISSMSEYVVKVGDRVIYVPRRVFRPEKNNFQPYEFGMLARLFSCANYEDRKAEFNFENFYVRELKVLLRHQGTDPRDWNDETCVLVGDFIDMREYVSVDSREGQKKLIELWLNFFKSEAYSAKKLRDIILGIFHCGIKSVRWGHSVFVDEDKWLVLGGGPSGEDIDLWYDSRSKKVYPPCFAPNEDVLEELGRRGLKEFFELLFFGDTCNVDFDDALVRDAVNTAVSFVKGNDCSVDEFTRLFYTLNDHRYDDFYQRLLMCNQYLNGV